MNAKLENAEVLGSVSQPQMEKIEKLLECTDHLSFADHNRRLRRSRRSHRSPNHGQGPAKNKNCSEEDCRKFVKLGIHLMEQLGNKDLWKELVAPRIEDYISIGLFDDLTTISENLGNCLEGRLVIIRLPGIRHLDLQQAKYLSRIKGRIVLNNLESMTPEVAGVLASAQADLSLSGLKPSPETLKILGEGHRGELVLGMKDISEMEATALQNHRGRVVLPNFEALSTDGVELLSRFDSLPGLSPPFEAMLLRGNSWMTDRHIKYISYVWRETSWNKMVIEEGLMDPDPYGKFGLEEDKRYFFPKLLPEYNEKIVTLKKRNPMQVLCWFLQGLNAKKGDWIRVLDSIIPKRTKMTMEPYVQKINELDPIPPYLVEAMCYIGAFSSMNSSVTLSSADIGVDLAHALTRTNQPIELTQPQIHENAKPVFEKAKNIIIS